MRTTGRTNPLKSIRISLLSFCLEANWIKLLTKLLGMETEKTLDTSTMVREPSEQDTHCDMIFNIQYWWLSMHEFYPTAKEYFFLFLRSSIAHRIHRSSLLPQSYADPPEFRNPNSNHHRANLLTPRINKPLTLPSVSFLPIQHKLLRSRPWLPSVIKI